jgi:A/G-specific adenine glycosylase
MNLKEKKFIETVWAYYQKEGRQNLPWRKTRNPYRILVSEVMLQQTQVERVIPKYKSFLKKFPSLASLASAPLGDVLREWQGLGYNRRAKMLHECAQLIMRDHKGIFPRSHAALMKLPGVGHYTAGAIMAFAHNEAIPIIETNIRTVFIHHFFKDKDNITDAETFQSIERLLDRENPREWYYALMDYGAYLKKTIGNQNTRSKHYTKQAKFNGSDRQIRGAIIRALVEGGLTRKDFYQKLSFDMQRIDEQLERLREEGMIVCVRQKYSLPK